MKAQYGIFLLVISLVFRIAGEVFGILHLPGSTEFWGISSACWTVGLLIVLIKALKSEQLRTFLNS